MDSILRLIGIGKLRGVELQGIRNELVILDFSTFMHNFKLLLIKFTICIHFSRKSISNGFFVSAYLFLG